LLDVLARHEAKATFFLVGSEVARFPDVARRLVAEGHAIGSHSAAHLDHQSVAADAAVADMLAGAEAIADVLGFEPALYRAPYGHFVPATIAEAGRRGWRCVRWSTLGYDWMEEATPRSVADRVLEGLEPGAIVLLHDSRRAKPMEPEPVIGATVILLEEIDRRGLRPVSLAGML
jgi:peptidoglycan-N-acetylglucosamine deacetylase